MVILCLYMPVSLVRQIHGRTDWKEGEDGSAFIQALDGGQKVLALNLSKS